MDDYVVRYGDDSEKTNRSFYMPKAGAEKFYSELRLGVETTWKELLYEPLDEEDTQYVLKSDSVRVVDLGLCKVAVPNKEDLI